MPFKVDYLAQLLAFVLIQTAKADFTDDYFTMICDDEAGKVEITHHIAENKVMYSAKPQNCTLKNGREIRVKMGIGLARPYGEGGAIPNRWFSVWVDKARVISQLPIAKNPTTTIKMTIDDTGITVCKNNGQLYKDLSEDMPECNLIPTAELNKKRDVIEFPSDNDKLRPADGAYVNVYAKDEVFCQNYQKSMQAIHPVGVHGKYKKMFFDIDNDGSKENVIAWLSRNHFRDGDVFFAYQKHALPSEEALQSIDTKTLAKSAKTVIPYAWTNSKTSKNHFSTNEEAAYVTESFSVPWWDSQNELNFRYRYTYLQPFKYKEKTYFLLKSNEAGKSHWQLVLYPAPNHQITEMCAFQTIQPHY